MDQNECKKDILTRCTENGLFSVHYKIKKSNGIYPYTVYVILKLSYYYL